MEAQANIVVSCAESCAHWLETEQDCYNCIESDLYDQAFAWPEDLTGFGDCAGPPQ